MIPSILAVRPPVQRTTLGCVGDRNSALTYPIRVSPWVVLISRTSR